DPRTILALPATAGKPMEVEGKAYRGAVEVLVNGSARLRAVNVVGLEDYLRGVVPHELGPGLYPELEALKAQAVAARTYVVANRGQFAADGYDVCDTPRCQVYEGSKGEDSLSDRAINETAGLVATYRGQPINALYTATCGGHTEDAANVFSQEKAPYLKGVDCYANEASLAAQRRTLSGAAPFAPVAGSDGASLDEGLALLSVLGILDPATAAPARMAETATSPEVSAATSRALAACGKPSTSPPLPQGAYPSVVDLARYLVSAFGWQDRVDVLLDPRDVVTLLGGNLLAGRATAGLPETAWLVKEGIFPPRLAAGDDLLVPATRALLYRALHRMVLKYDAAGLARGIFRGGRGSSLLVIPEADEAKSLGAAREIEPSPEAWLAREGTDGTSLAAELSLVPGDRLSWHQGKDGRADFIRQKANVKGASDDRFTAVYQWEVRYTRKELQDKIRERASIGELIDVTPTRRGVSGRVSELVVTGSAGRFTFHGFPIRTLLGLRENLFVVDRQRDADGRVETFVFTGKGWGHGVGLCQVGAFGMALRGAGYEEILKRYYTGIEIEPLAR
ncbi:MAG TPA: SpoIID/LytB domain-containing protein, partial [Verrucomicrobiae bacterium]|nr:SpoIID/LytB domain-containing protein [Verrucomicrobiae bacterium]